MGLRDQLRVWNQNSTTHTHVRSIAESNREEAAEPRAHTHARLKLPIPVFEYFLRYSYPVIGVTRPLLAAMGGCPPLNTTHTHTPYDRYRLTWNVLRPVPLAQGLRTPHPAELKNLQQ